jgi:hypothetical protein
MPHQLEYSDKVLGLVASLLTGRRRPAIETAGRALWPDEDP